jgi:hypothetical protein
MSQLPREYIVNTLLLYVQQVSPSPIGSVLDSVGLTLSLKEVWLCAPCCVLSDGLVGVGIGEVCGEWLDLEVGAPVDTVFSCGHQPF